MDNQARFLTGAFMILICLGTTASYGRVWESFETKARKCEVADWGTKAKSVEIAPANATHGKNSLKMSVDGLTSEADATFNCNFEENWSANNIVTMDVFNATKTPIDLSFAISTGAKWQWFEANPITLKPGWNKALAINLSKADFKSEGSGWKHTTKIENLKEVKRISFKLLTKSKAKTSGAIFVDNINLK